ncbi:MAG: response regulator [Rhizobiales bacterium]|nr:response regulator [Hyphomicrobiales bacterium]
MTCKGASGAPDPARSIDRQTAIHVVAEHDSLRRSLVALLKAWGASPVAFKKGRGLLRSYREDARRPDCMIVDTHGLDRTLTSFLSDLRRLEPAPPVLILHGSGRSLERDLAAVDQRNIAGLLKPYLSGELYAAVRTLLEHRC